jgi:hypothetical protein
MSKKYLIFYLILGVIFLTIAIIGLVKNEGTYSDAYFFIPAILFFYASFKIYKLENDDELM